MAFLSLPLGIELVVLLCSVAVSSVQSIPATLDLNGPQLVGDTPPDGSCILVPFGKVWTEDIVVQSNTE